MRSTADAISAARPVLAAEIARVLREQPDLSSLNADRGITAMLAHWRREESILWSVLSDVAIAAAVAEFTPAAEFSDELEHAVREAADAVLPVEVSEAVETAGDVDNTSFSGLTAALFSRILAYVSHNIPWLTPELALNIALALMLALIQHFEGVRDHAEVLEALHEQQHELVAIRGELREEARRCVLVARAEHRFRARRALLLHENPEARARRVGVIPTGAEVVAIEQVNRWLYVVMQHSTDDGDSAGHDLRGWVYFRNLEPIGP